MKATKPSEKRMMKPAMQARKREATTNLEDVAGCLPYKGRPKTVEETDAAIAKEVKRRHGRG